MPNLVILKPPVLSRHLLAALAVAVLLLCAAGEAWAHNVAEGDKGYIQESSGVLFWPFVYLGAKHMVTGYDHLLFLFGVIFFLYRMKDIGIYVTLFAIGHSTTLLLGVLTGISANAYIIDAIIGLSVVYKALDNLGAYQRWFGFSPTPRLRHSCSASFMALVWQPKSLNFKSRKTGWCPISSLSTLGSRLASFSRSGAF